MNDPELGIFNPDGSGPSDIALRKILFTCGRQSAVIFMKCKLVKFQDADDLFLVAFVGNQLLVERVFPDLVFMEVDE